MAPDFLSADVITSEVQGNSAQIPTASTSAFGIAGYSPRGPEGTATIVTSFQQFATTFGSFTKKSLNAYAATAYFNNGGNILVFVRALHSDALYATATFDGPTWFVQASGRGIWANGTTMSIQGSPNFFDNTTGLYSAWDVKISIIDPNTGILTVDETYEALDLINSDDPSYITNIINNESQDVTLQSVSGGGIPASLLPTTQSNVLFATGVVDQNVYAGNVSGTGLPILPGSMSFAVSGVDVGTDDGNGNIIGTTVSGSVGYTTGAILFFVSPAPNMGDALTTSYIQQGAASDTVTLSGGFDGSAVLSNDVVGAQLQVDKAGIYAFDNYPNQFALALPDFAGDPTTLEALIGYAANRADVLVITEPPQGSTPQGAVNYNRNTVESVSSYAAMYYPWVKVPDPLNNGYPLTMPPSGHVAGRYAYTDLNANVGKAPAGVNRGQITGFISGLERSLSKPERDLVYPAKINPIRSDSQVGIAIWGNATLQLVGDFTDVNIRRVFIFLEKTQQVGLLDQVFEDVGPVTWGVIKTRCDTFLEGLYLTNVIGSGVASKDQAYKVVCDASNNPPAIQARKIIIVDEFIKPNLAAEVIWVRLQSVADASQA
jgi:hypothetical protein